MSIFKYINKQINSDDISHTYDLSNPKNDESRKLAELNNE